MRNPRSFFSLLGVAMFFACVVSCDEQDEKLETRNSFTNHEVRDRDGLRTGEVNFDGTEGDPLDLTTARRWTGNFRKKITREDEIRAHYFGNDIIQGILNQPGCVGVRIYYAIDDIGDKKLLVIGVDASGKDLLPVEGGRVDDEGGNTIADYSMPCPTLCSPDL